MTPRMEADFDWTEVQAAVPVHDKGDYELTIERVRAQAWYKNDKQGNQSSDITKVIKLTPRVVGQYDSTGKLDTTGKAAGKPAEEISLWIHSEGARQMSKKHMMAISGYNPNEESDEKKFNEFLRSSGLDLKTSVEEGEDGKLILKIGEGYEKLLKGKNVRGALDQETYQAEGKEPVIQQKYARLSPVNVPAKGSQPTQKQQEAAPSRGRGREAAGAR